jgi:hypothetical protein
MSAEARSAATALLELGDSPNPVNVQAFVNRYGPLTLFRKWVEIAGWAVDGKIHAAFRAMRRGRADGLDEAIARWSASPGTEMEVGSFDWSTLRSWLDIRGYAAEDLYIDHLRNRIFDVPSITALEPLDVPEPIAFYGWCAHKLQEAQRDLLDGELTGNSRQWITDRLSQTQFRLSDTKGTLQLHALNLLAYLAAQTVLSTTGRRMEVRECARGDCPNTFSPKQSRSRFCSTACRETAKKRQRRASGKRN